MRFFGLPRILVVSTALTIATACSAGRTPLLSYGSPDVYVSALVAPPSLTPIGGGTYALHLPPLAGSTPVSVLPRLKVRKELAIVTGHMTFEPQTGPFEITLRGARAQPGAVSFVWEDPDGTRHPILAAGLEAPAEGESARTGLSPALPPPEGPQIEDLSPMEP